MKNNLQYRRMNRDIMDAFIKLLQTKPFEKIVIRDIMDVAMVNRSTFYNHFKDKYEIAERLQGYYVDTFKIIIEEIQKKGPTQLAEINELTQSYFVEHRAVLKALIKIRTEKVNLVGEWNKFYQTIYLTSTDSPNAEIEASIFSNIFISFMTYYIENDNLFDDYSRMFLSVFMNVAMRVLSLENDQEIRQIIYERIGENHVHSHKKDDNIPDAADML